MILNHLQKSKMLCSCAYLRKNPSNKKKSSEWRTQKAAGLLSLLCLPIWHLVLFSLPWCCYRKCGSDPLFCLPCDVWWIMFCFFAPSSHKLYYNTNMKPYWEILDIVSIIMIFLVALKNYQIWHHSHAGRFFFFFFIFISRAKSVLALSSV